MKNRNLPLLLSIFFITYSYAQSTLGIQTAYGTETDMGIGVKINIEFENSVIEISPNATYFFGKKTTVANYTVLATNLDAHYRFKKEEKFNYYPLMGVNLSFINSKTPTQNNTDNEASKTKKNIKNTLKNGANSTEFGINTGIGFSYKLSDSIRTFLEAKYIIGGLNQGVINLGLSLSI